MQINTKQLPFTKREKAILKAVNNMPASSAIATLNYCISHISNTSTFTFVDKNSSKNPSKGKV